MTEQLTLLGALIALGAILKHVVPSDAVNRWIPAILILFALVYLVSESIISGGVLEPKLFLEAILTSAEAVGLHQTVKATSGLKL